MMTGNKFVTVQNKSYANSLTQLTLGFLELMSESPNKVLNVNDIATQLRVPKRRIYDITCILEGI